MNLVAKKLKLKVWKVCSMVISVATTWRNSIFHFLWTPILNLRQVLKLMLGAGSEIHLWLADFQKKTIWLAIRVQWHHTCPHQFENSYKRAKSIEYQNPSRLETVSNQTCLNSNLSQPNFGPDSYKAISPYSSQRDSGLESQHYSQQNFSQQNFSQPRHVSRYSPYHSQPLGTERQSERYSQRSMDHYSPGPSQGYSSQTASWVGRHWKVSVIRP